VVVDVTVFRIGTFDKLHLRLEGCVHSVVQVLLILISKLSLLVVLAGLLKEGIEFFLGLQVLLPAILIQ